MDTAKDKQPINTGKKLMRHNCIDAGIWSGCLAVSR